jgi:hypothetical protein
MSARSAAVVAGVLAASVGAALAVGFAAGREPDTWYVDAGATDGARAADGTQFVSSTGFDGGRFGTPPSAPVEGRLGDEVLRTAQIGMESWAAEVSPGRYRVTLVFAETYWTQPGQRVFSVDVEGRPLVRDLDLVAVAGVRRQLDRSILVGVPDGVVDIAFRASTDLPVVSAIEVVPAG